MKLFHIMSKIGLLIELAAFFMMIVLVLCGRPVPDLVMFMFAVGFVITLAPACIPGNHKDRQPGSSLKGGRGKGKSAFREDEDEEANR